MGNLHDIPIYPSSEENPRQWLGDYLHIRADLASSGSEFRCDPACTRPGCRNVDLLVPVSIVDLLGAALQLNAPVSELYQRHYSLGLLSHDRTDLIRNVVLQLKKPCPFLQDDLCGIYPVRPLPCMLFPEYIAYEGTFAATAQNPHFRDFLCLRRPPPLSPERARVLVRLRKMWTRESLISSYYLFQDGACYLDFGNLTRELVAAAGGSGEETSPPGPLLLRAISHRILQNYFQERLARFEPFAGVPDKLQQLDRSDGQAQFLQLLRDDRLVKKLGQVGDDRARVYRLVKGALRAERRSLLPAEYKFL